MKHSLVWSTIALLVLAGGGTAFLLAPAGPVAPAAADADAERHDDAHAHARGPRVEKPVEGEVPTRVDAAAHLERRGSIVIDGDDAWNPANGVRGGTGTPSDPFVISDHYVDVIHVSETTKCFEITGNYVSRILILDWTGPCGLVHHNHLNDFRTNRNVERAHDPTSAVITENRIRHVTELRHFDGALTHNEIGDPDRVLPGPRVVLNIAGLNAANITENHVYGGVDMKLHGHHHGSAYGAASHNHGVGNVHGHAPGAVNHSIRYIDFLFTGNVIESDRFGLRYNDLDHEQDDRQAASEQEPALEEPHHHFTTVRITGNEIRGAGVRVAVFNAPDARHIGNDGTVIVEENVIEAPLVGNAVTLRDVRDAEVIVRGNVVEEGPVKLDGASGVLLERFRNATVSVTGNEVPGFRYGVRAHGFDANTTWRVSGNLAPGARYDVYWDETVANPPEGAHGRSGEKEEDEDGAPARRRDLPRLPVP